DDETAAGRRQLGIERRLGETVYVVEIRHAARKREALGLGLETVDRDGDAGLVQRGDDRIEAADFRLGRDRLGGDVAGRGADIDNIGAVLRKLPRPRQCRRGVEI